MIQTGFESRIKVQDLIDNQLPEFILEESPNAVEFLKQYYISQEYQGGPIDISDNLDQYLKIDNLKPEVIVDSTTTSSSITSIDTTISVSNTKGFPNQYGLLKIDDEIITYTGITTNSFTGCVRGFSGVTDYHQDLNKEELVFSTSTAAEHSDSSSVQNLSSLFLKDFYKKLKYTFTPGLENIKFSDQIDVGNFIKRAKDFYSSKGTDEAVKILFKVIFGETPSIVNLEDYLIKPSSANYVRREVAIVELISGEPSKIVGQTLIKTTDENTTASISAIEPFSRKGKTFHKIEFYIGNTENSSSVVGNFEITPNTKLIESVSVGSSILTVDSTVSFPQSGTLVSGNNTISYTGKSINQFFGCTGISDTISTASNIRSDDTYFSYEDGDTSKKVELILLGVIQDLVEENEDFKVDENDIIVVKNLGNKIKNSNSNWKEIFANSFIYNTSARYKILDNTSVKLGSTIDRSSLKIGDEVEILERGSEIVVSSANTPYIQDIDTSVNSLSLINKPTLEDSKEYDIRRKLNKTKSSGSDFGSSSVLSDILNLYVDKDEYAYVASNSLPSEEKNVIVDEDDDKIIDYRLDIETNIKKVSIASTNNLADFSGDVYNTIEFNPSIPFLTGDKIYYFPQDEPLVGLQTGNYYVKLISANKFKLYATPSLLDSNSNVTFQIPNSGIGTHNFVLNSQVETDLGIQKLLRKFPLEKNIENGSGTLTVPGTTGMLINGVEINNYKSKDVIYYGPIEDVDILSGGENFDVINPPLIEVSTGIGTTAKIQPVISGSFEKVYVDTQNYNIDRIVSIDISGGNGSGAVIEPVIIEKPREVLFNADEFSSGGGVSETTNQIIFLTDHNFVNGQEIIYNPLGNNPIAIGTAGNNIDLPTNSTYFVGVTNNKAIKLYNNLSDQQSDTNVVGIYTGSIGSHKFSTLSSSKQISYVKIIDKGEGYTNRKLIVKPTGISTTNNTVTFKNHGFNDGEIIEYDYESGQISGITTTNQYFVLKIDDSSFRICNAGVGGTIISNYERKDYVEFNSTGSGYQYFKYPDISVTINYNSVGFGTTTQTLEDLVVTPVVKGDVIDAYVYENGTGYGSTTLNLKKNPTISIKNGKFGQVTPFIVDGKITNVSISYVGIEYYSVPDLVVSGSGTGAELRAIVSNGQITEVKILNTGIGYSASNTKIEIVPSGKNVFIDPQIRKLSLNNNTVRFTTGEVLLKGKDKLQYSVSEYFDNLRDSFKESPVGSATTIISHIIGWAYDGNPIYGPYGYINPNDTSSGLKSLESGYSSNLSNIEDRPSGFDVGFFVEDYKFNGDGDLDEYNGRYEKNIEYPNGVYAYHATINQFPYFIGNKYKSKLISDSDLNQSFDFNNSNLLRNTLPYKVSELNANYDFINETSDVLDQKIEVLSVTSDSVKSIEIENSGSDYKVGDKLIFDDTDTSGSGLDVSVASVEGNSIVELNTNSTEYLNSIFTWDSSDRIKVTILPKHDLLNLDHVTISGFSTNLSILNGTHQITVPSYSNGRCISTIASASVGFTTEIYVSPIPDQVSVGSSINIGTETLKVLEVFKNQNILRIERGLAGVSHTVGTAVTFSPDSFTISKSVDKFDSKVNDKAFFNPRESVGVGTISGVGYSTSFTFGDISTVTRSIPTKGIYIENHPFVTNQPVVYTSDGTTLTVSTDGTSVPVNIPSNLFIVKKSPSIIGLKTAITGEELFFHTNGVDNDQYSFESNYTQILGDVDKNVVTVSVSTSHELQNGDTVTLDVQPNLSVGTGTSTAVRVLYKSEIDNIVVNPIGFNSTGINTVTNEITISNHELVTGDKVLYEDDNFEYLIETSDQLNTNAQDSSLQSLRFKPDGTKMYALGSSADEVNEYALSTPWSVSTAVFTDRFDVTSEDGSPTGLYIREDGLKFWIVANSSDTIYQYSMTSAWDLTTASYDNVSLLVGSGNSIDGFSQQIVPTGLYFKYDGSVLYLIGGNGDFIHQFNLSTSWDITTASYSGDSTGRLDVNPPDANPNDIHINSSGTLVYWVGAGSDNIYIYKLSTPWDIVTGTELDRIDLGSPNTPTVMSVSPDEENFYVGSSGNDVIRTFIRPSPLTNSEYYVYKINRNKINLCETLIDSQQNPPTVVSFASTGSSSQSIALINPQLQPVKNNNLVFDLSDSSLINYSLRLYQDKEFNNEFVSTGSTNTFSVSGVGTVGVTSTATLTLDYNSQIGELFYNLEKDGVLVKSDTDVNNYSSIKYINSDYNNSYIISGVASTTFNVNIDKKPEKLSYGSTECDTLEYSTTSTSPSGPVKSLSIISSGTGYKKLPTLKSTNSTSGIDLIVNAKSINVGSIKESRVINNRFTYSSDKTLRPKINVSPNIIIKDSDTLSQISIVSGGEGYVSPPTITLVNSTDGSIIDSGFIEAKITGSAISSLNIKVQPKGLPDETVKVFTTNNNNGVAIEKVESSNTGIFTCIISTPGIGNTFNTPPFADGDEVFIEGVSKFSSDGGGFNSSDYGFKFFKVTGYDNTSLNDKVTINIGEFTTNTGIAKTIQDFSGVIINKNDYPTFKVVQEPSKFLIGEMLSSNQIIRDLKVTGSDEDSLKVLGSYELSIGEVVTGNDSGTVATIKSLNLNEGTFNVGYSNDKDIGWDTEIGKLNEDFQVIPDNNYYQNLSYSIKSSVTYEDQQSPVESLVHTSGLKNFADTGITSNTSAGLSTTKDGVTIVYDVIDEKRVDTINNFDNVIDIDVLDSKSKFLKLKNKKLTNYTELKNLNVLSIDDLQNQFSNSESESTEFLLVEELENRTYFNYLLRVTSEDDSEIQLTDVTILKDGNESFIVENESISGQEFNYGTFDLFTNNSEETFLRFVPNDAFNTNYNLKLIKQIFNTNLSGVGTQSIGFINLTGSVDIENTSVGIGTTTIISVNSNTFESLYINAQVTNSVTQDMNYVRLYVSVAGTNTYMSEYYSDSNVLNSSTGNQIGTFYSNIDSGILSITHENDESEEIKIRTNIVGFGTTTTGIGTYRFKSSDQFDGQERSVIYDSRYYSTVSASSTTVQTLDRTLFNASKSLVQVSIGSTKALHQVMMVTDQTNVYTQQLPFLSVSNDDILDDASGIGTFGGEISGSDLILKFYPDSNQTGLIDIEVFSKSLYSDLDTINEPLDLSYGTVTESIDEKFYDAINLSRINKDSFALTDNGTPIFSKQFNPNSVALAATTGIFTIEDHFFVTGEELIYTPNSTIIGIGTSAMLTASGELPSTVYAIKIEENTFKVAITPADAAAGIGTTFASLGEGNAHRFTMKERNTKCIITVDELVQYPLAPTKTTHTLSGPLNSVSTIVSLSGISTINPSDILKVDDEYMGVTNVGLGTTNVGPITNVGSINLVNVKRGFVGSAASSHADSTLVRIHKGAFNIEDNEIYFAEAPRGNPQISKTENNLDFETSSFTGRVFFKSNYDNNKVYDDLSDEFTGIGRTFTLKVGGANTTGLGTEGASGLVFINNIYQSPKTDNNPTRFNYQILEDSSVGITTLEFSGITRPGTDPLEYFVSDYDVNANEVPRGGIIVSYGSTPGLGFAPLVGASVTAVVGAGGSFISVGLGTTDNLGSGYNGLVSIGVTVLDIEYDHKFVSAGVNSITDNTGGTHTATDATYNSRTGDLVLTVANHGLTTANTIGIATEGLVFTCSKDDHATNHPYPRAVSKTKLRRGESGGDPIHNQQVAIAATTLNTIQIGVGSGGGAGTGAVVSVDSIGIGGTLSFNVGSAGTDYVNPEIFVSDPSYKNLPIVGVSRLGIGATTDTGNGLLVDLKVSGSTGIGSTLFEVSEVKFSRPGYNFRRGDVFKPVGLVTDGFLSSPISDFEITVIDTYSDNFAAWEFGELDYIDSIQNLQDGSRVRFPLNYNSALLSFEPESDSAIEKNINNVLVIFVNGVIQKPIENYIFEGGTSFVFTRAPLPQDEIEIYFYKGVDGTDSILIDNIIPTIETGDIVQVISNNIYPDTITQDERTVYNITTSDKFETNRYVGLGIDETNDKPLSWTKQKTDKKINGQYVYKSRDVLEPLIFPTARIIKDVSTTDTEIFVDNVELFNYETDNGYTDSSVPLDAVIINGISTESTGSIEKITGFANIAGFSGIVTGITTASGIGVPLALQFTVFDSNNFSGLSTGYPIYIYDTQIGSGVTSIDNSNSAVVGIGTTFLDNVYYVSDWSNSSTVGILTCNVDSGSPIVGLGTTGNILNPVGKYSWGRIYGATGRSTNPISIGVTGNTVSGLTTYPTIQRRGIGIRKTGALPKREV